MPDQIGLAIRSAFDGLLPRIGDEERAGVFVKELTGLAPAILLAGRSTVAALSEKSRAAYGVVLPDGPEVAASGEIAFLGLGPRRWLALRPGDGRDWCVDLDRSFAGLASAVDQSDGFGILEIRGPNVREALAKGVPVDLHPWAFGTGSVAVTTAGHIGVTLWQVDAAPVYRLAVARSLAGSFSHWLSTSAAEFGIR